MSKEFVMLGDYIFNKDGITIVRMVKAIDSYRIAVEADDEVYYVGTFSSREEAVNEMKKIYVKLTEEIIYEHK